MLIIRKQQITTLLLLSLVYTGFYYFLGHPFNFIRSWIIYNQIQPLENIIPLHYPYTLPQLPYKIDALQPHIDEMTLQIHHEFHHKGYINKINESLKKYPNFQQCSLIYLLTHLHKLPYKLQKSVRNNGGGHLAHTLYWYCMTSPNNYKKPSQSLMKKLEKSFKSFDQFKKEFSQAAISHFGSGWAWLCLNNNKNLVIIPTSEHDTPLELGLFPILVADVWEHAYYLKYQNKRSNYIASWWNLVNWEFVEQLYLFYLGASPS